MTYLNEDLHLSDSINKPHIDLFPIATEISAKDPSRFIRQREFCQGPIEF